MNETNKDASIEKLRNENARLIMLVNQLSNENADRQRPHYLEIDGLWIRTDVITVVEHYGKGARINRTIETLALPLEILSALDAQCASIPIPDDRRPLPPTPIEFGNHSIGTGGSGRKPIEPKGDHE